MIVWIVDCSCLFVVHLAACMSPNGFTQTALKLQCCLFESQTERRVWLRTSAFTYMHLLSLACTREYTADSAK
jgi:hypothetical protein